MFSRVKTIWNNKLNKNKVFFLFKVPDGYFDTLCLAISWDKIHKEKSTSLPVQDLKFLKVILKISTLIIFQKLENEPVETKIISLKSYKKHFYAVAS